MHRRPFAGTKQRPLSAIFIGSLDSTSTPPDLPGLPEPPSPSGSSNRSGLPSPPATNSTGSGSVGEDQDTATEGSHRKKSSSLVHSKPDMLNGINDRFGGRSRRSFDDDDDVLNDYDNDEEHTARLSLDSQRSPKMVPSDNVSAIKRAATLAERNRLVINRLSALSRTSSPVPPKTRTTFSPPNAPSPSASSSGAKPRAPSRSSQSSSTLHRNSEIPHSGSETEREARNGYGHSYSSSDSLSATPTSTFSEIKPSNYIRPRQLSAPDSPARAMQAVARTRQRDRDRSRGSSPGPSRTPRKRVSMATTPSEYRYHEESDNDQEDVTIAALAAIASTRRSPADGSGGKKRPTLPKEFREKDRRSIDGRQVEPPSTPRRNRDRERERRSPSPTRSPRTAVSFLADPTSPRRPGAARYSTVRDLTRKHQTRWMSEDLSASVDGDDDPGRGNGVGRRQGHRAGSSDSPLVTASSRMLSEGLRAAGLTKRRDPGEDVFANGGQGSNQATVPRRTRSTGANSMINGNEVESPIQAMAPSRINEGVGPPSSRTLDPRTPGYAGRTDRSVTYSGGPRPGTSMAALHSDTPPLRAPPSRTYRSPYGLDRELPLYDDAPRQDRAYSSPFAPMRSTPAPLPSSALSGSSQDPHTEHRRLMMESLSMFESQLSRLPPMGQTTTSTVPEVFQTSQHLVHMMDRLNVMLKTSTNKALEAQIDHEVSDFAGMSVAEVIATIGMEHRDNLRLSDEVVRTMTAFLLSVGRLLRDTTAVREQQHLRTMSLDEEAVVRRATPEIATPSADRRSSDGRRSRETRRSWDPREPGQTLQRMSSLERNSNGRPGSSGISRTASSSEHSANDAAEGTPQTVRNGTSALASSSRKPYAPREHRLSSQSVSLSQSQLATFDLDSPGYEPSPTPASRQTDGRFEHSRALPPLSIPPSLSSIPSESLLRRSATSSTSASTNSTDRSANRRKVSGNSILTVRAEPSSTPLMPITKGGAATTAVTTHTVSNSPEDGPVGLQRSESTSSSRTNGVTFSRPSTISVSTLTGLQQQRGSEHPSLARLRTASHSTEFDDPANNLRSPMSGSETERPRTMAARSRVSLDGRGPTPESIGRSSQASTLVQSRRERRRTITEIFS
ncbi:hypothetical protein BXZ70DRAFT_607042 [Cristinia sonorae]|uniref:Uncharacterized protein n=1 Tax=Cristinia sonorae TaxID=1940300 RepID=A0A8K0UUG0_9AGAR|nr:hypothetical protein BXZ70DRAFT_607042 [Cristinia sonorae]